MTRTDAAAAAAVGALSIAALSGCAGNQPMPLASINQAEQRIEEAERADAQRFANRELNLARETLTQAREAQQDGDEEHAARLAQRAELDAVYAAAIADNEEIQVAVQELRETLSTLETEVARAAGGGAEGSVEADAEADPAPAPPEQ